MHASAAAAAFTLESQHVPSPSQRSAIEAGSEPLLVLAGPGAGKTFCLIERIHFLIRERGFDPARICAFTFTNRAAGEIAARLERRLGPDADRIKRGTIHAFCSELLREFGEHVRLEPGFGIADEEYQLSVLRRLEGPRRWHRRTLTRFCSHRFRGDPLREEDTALLARYTHFLETRNLVDFDMLVLKAAELLRDETIATAVAGRWDAVLVDEFQDLNRTQYDIIRRLASGHRNLFAVGDDEQSIYSWAGATPQVFEKFLNDFEVTSKVQLRENRRCPREIVALARRLVTINIPLFADKKHAESDRDSPFPTTVFSFGTEDDEIAWIMDDLRRDREAHARQWGDYALLYRTNEIGSAIESALLTTGIPCRLARGRALADDPIVAYLLAALRVIAAPEDPIHQECFLDVVLPRPLFDAARAKAEESRQGLLDYLAQHARGLPREHGDRSKIWRGLYALQNLAALGARQTDITSLIDELLSHRVGEYRTALEENHDELTDPAEHEEVRQLAARLTDAFDAGQQIWLPPLGGAAVGLKGLLASIDINRVTIGGSAPPESLALDASDAPTLGLPLALFKAAQLMRSGSFANNFRDFTAVDLETTDKLIDTAEVVEIAAVRVRDGVVCGEFQSLVKPRVPISAGARDTHGIDEADVATAPFFEDVWPAFREFCGSDILVAHNGYRFDFPILRRMAAALPDCDVCTYDTLLLARELRAGSARLTDLARHFGIETGQSHRALDDTRALARVFLALGDAKIARARKTALPNALGHLAVALALSDVESHCVEAGRLMNLGRAAALGRFGNCLEYYEVEREQIGDETLPTVADLVRRLGGEKLMQRIRAEKTAEQRYPVAMQRLRPLLAKCAGKPLPEQIAELLERAALSRLDGIEPESGCVNLLTLHSTKGLEFSRVYIVGTEDAQLPGNDPSKSEIEEARRLLYVGMTRTMDRLVLTRVEARAGKPTGGHRFLDEMGLTPARRTREPAGSGSAAAGLL